MRENGSGVGTGAEVSRERVEESVLKRIARCVLGIEEAAILIIVKN